MKIRILDRILVAVAGLLLIAICAGIVGQVFFGKDVIGFVSRILPEDQTIRRIIIGVGAAIVLLIGLYCLLMLFRHRGRNGKFVTQKLESGELSISLKTIETMVRKCVDQHNEIKTDSIQLENQRDGLLIRIRGEVAGGISIPLTTDTLQKQIKQYVTACSGVEVKGIRVQIESSGADAKDAPFAIEPPANMLLTKGEETRKEETEARAVSGPVHTAAAQVPAPAEEERPAENGTGRNAADAAAVVMAAAENLQDSQTEEDGRPIHQRLFSVQEEPCIMPLPPENSEGATETETDGEAAAEENSDNGSAADPDAGTTDFTDKLKGEEKE